MQIIQHIPLHRSCKIAIVVSDYNAHITHKLLAGALERLQKLGIPDKDITVVKVPGAVELPIVAQCLAKVGEVEAIICLGAVIRGDTDHYDYVCDQASSGCQDVALKFGIPVIFGVLTTQDEKQALARVGGEHGHKGKEAAESAIQMVSILRQLVN